MVTEISNKINFGEKVKTKEYLYMLGVQIMPEFAYLKRVEGDVFAKPELLECKVSNRQTSEEGLKNAEAKYEAFKQKTEDELKELVEKDYESKMRQYEEAKKEIAYFEDLTARAHKQLDKFENFPVFKEKATEVIEKLEKQIIEAKEKVVEPVKQTIQDYREEKIIAYEDGLQEYKKLMEKEAKLDIQGINEEIKSFMEVLNGIEENNDSSEESEGNQND